MKVGSYSFGARKKFSGARIRRFERVAAEYLAVCPRPQRRPEYSLEKADQLLDDSKPIAWFLTICRSIWLNQLRSQKIRAAQSLDSTPEVELSALNPSAEANIFASEVFTKVMGLPEAQRETVLLVYVEGFTYREAAGMLGIPIGTVMSRLAAARRKLADFQSETNVEFRELNRT